jgi:hypothetical protein
MLNLGVGKVDPSFFGMTKNVFKLTAESLTCFKDKLDLKALLITLLANPLNQEIHFFAAIALWQRNSRDMYLIEAGGLPAVFAFKMDVVVVMVSLSAGFTA